MAWTSPQTWTSALVTVAEFNEQIRDNLNFLFAPDSDATDYDEGTDKTTTSTSFTAVDTAGGTDLRASLTTSGEDVAVTFLAFVKCENNGANAGGLYFNILIDGTTHALSDDGIQAAHNANWSTATNNHFHVFFRIIITGLSAAAHTFDVEWKVSAAGGTTTGTLYAGAGTTRLDTRPQLDARKAA